ncbi:MAG: hypothetical protein WDO24_04910 [Pseudomonadota bacterium]
MYGSLYNDLLTGNPAGGSQLLGNDGNDTLVSQGSGDTLTGGNGGDIFTFNNPTATGSVITDFHSDVDGIDLRPVLSAMNYQGSNAYADGHITTAAVTGGVAISGVADRPSGRRAPARRRPRRDGAAALGLHALTSPERVTAARRSMVTMLSLLPGAHYLHLIWMSMTRAAGDRRYSATVSPEPPSSAGKSFSLGSPSFIGSTVSA